MPLAPLSLPAPRGMLLDFGGVIIETAKRPQGRAEVVTELGHLLERAGQPIVETTLRASLDAGLQALKSWKNASSRRRHPREMSHREVVGDFVAADLPDAARAVLVGQAAEVLELMGCRISEHHLRPGIPDVLTECEARGVPVGIVSNAHSGRHHRRILDELGLGHRFAVQVYSDEVGIRKPHPGMIELAAQALDLPPADCWYVGDTQDRDVVAGRRAGVAVVLLTRTRHTDNPPFAVTAQADATFDTPVGVLEALRASRSLADTPTRAVAASPAGELPTPGAAPAAALLLDHGGVISTSRGRAEAPAELSAHLVELLATGGFELDPQRATTMVREGLASYRATKHLHDDEADVPQSGPEALWVDHVGAGASERVRAVLRAHAHDLMHRWYAAKAEHTLRPGVRELLETCRGRGIPVVMVSNTVSGRGVRERLAGHGVDHLIAGHVFSDEAGRRKPDVALVREALAMVDVPASACWFLGDQARTDGVAASLAGVGRRVLTRGGKGTEEQLQRALETGLATDLVDSPADLIPLLTDAISTDTPIRDAISTDPLPTDTSDAPPGTTAYPDPEHTPDTQRTA